MSLLLPETKKENTALVVVFFFDDFVVWCEVALTIQDLYIQIKKKMLLKLINL